MRFWPDRYKSGGNAPVDGDAALGVDLQREEGVEDVKDVGLAHHVTDGEDECGVVVGPEGGRVEVVQNDDGDRWGQGALPSNTRGTG